MFNKLLILIILLFAVFISCDNVSGAASSPDAIAIRVIPNTNHYSAMSWYKEQKFNGSPQSLIVDGYEGVRDGRTVYVNAANIGADNTIYTNIYLISYSQEAEQATKDIFGEILSHWKFNSNFPNPDKCDKTATTDCLIDGDCPSGEYCQSAKAKIIRDTRRLADMSDIKIVLEKYKQAHGKYPELASGSYLTNKTLSTWPSWQETLSKELGTGLPNDPINKLGACAGYDATTCWNEQTKKFADSNLGDVKLNLPADSHTYVYTSSDKGITYDLCGVMESGLIIDFSQGACAESAKTAKIGDTAENHPPVFSGKNLPIAESGASYQGFVSASDPDNDSLNWIFSIIDCPLWVNLKMVNTDALNQKKIKADKVGQAVDCKFNISLNDNRGGQINQDFTIKTVNGYVPVISPIGDQTVVVGKNLIFTIKADEADHQYPLSFSFTGAPTGFDSSSGLHSNQHYFNVNGLIIDTTKDYDTTVIASDIYQGASEPVNFKISVINHPPFFTSAPPNNATACVNYNYTAQTNDPDGHTVSYFDPSNSLPAGLSLNETTGQISGKPQNTGVFHINLEARDQYYVQTDPNTNAKAEQDWNLNVVPENFAVTAPADSEVWVFANGGAGLYFNPINGHPTQYNAAVSTNVAGHVVYKLSDAGHPAPAATLAITPTFVISIDADGNIQGTPTHNVNDLGAHTVTVTATNDCGVSKTDNFIITVKKNEWCSDGTCHSAAGETENCFTCAADCACGPHAVCDGISACQCNANWTDCEGNKNNGCECDQNAGGNCQNGACVYNCIFDTSTFGNCVF